MNKVCSSCNAVNVNEAKFCRKCGKQNFKERTIVNNESCSSFENITELDMFFSDEYSEEKKEKFRQQKDIEKMEKRIKEIDEALKGKK